MPPRSRSTLLLVLAPLAAAVALLALRGRGLAAREPAGSGVALVELFTSQGCSSCPPADRLLTRLADDPRYRGRIVPLSFHVDYWNHIGWTDPFSSDRWSRRQRAYARDAFRNGRVYTPQVVVDGRAELVGSHEAALRQQLDAALARQPDVALSLSPRRLPRGGVAVEAVARPARAPVAELDLWLAIFERGLVTPVGAGENARATLRNDHVVRRLQRVLVLPRGRATAVRVEVPLALDAAWNAARLGVAVFVQDPASLAVHGAAAAELPAP